MDKKIRLLMSWLAMSQKEVLDKFHSIQGAFSDGKGDRRFVFIDGTRPDKALLVAHSDTVWGETKIQPVYHGGMIFSKSSYEVDVHKKNNIVVKRENGIGADDRAGCFAVWALRNMGHSILITSGEEQGCISSSWLMKSEWWQKKIAEHQFAVQFDRRGHKDIVFYDVATKDFIEYVREETKYSVEKGSYTDIRELCQDICGVNISIGFYNEHTSEEKLVPKHTFNTINTVYNWLSNKLPKFPLVKEEYKYYNPKIDTTSTTTKTRSSSNKNVKNKNKSKNKSQLALVEALSGDMVKCGDCKKLSNIEIFFENGLKCPNCNKEI